MRKLTLFLCLCILTLSQISCSDSSGGGSGGGGSSAPDMSGINPCELFTLEEAIALLGDKKTLKIGGRRSMNSRVVSCSVVSESGIPQFIVQVLSGTDFANIAPPDMGYEGKPIEGQALPATAVYQKEDPKYKIDRQLYLIGIKQGEFIVTFTPSYLNIKDETSPDYKKLLDFALKAAGKLKV